MTDPLTMSRSAREALSRGLNALQGDPNVPPALVELAAPIAQAMAALHQVEQTRQVQPHAAQALDNVRKALAGLQSAPSHVPAVQAAMEAVASALGNVNSLASAPPPPSHQAPQAYQPPQPAPAAAPAHAPAAQADPFAARPAGAPNMGGATAAIPPQAAMQAQQAAAHAAAAAPPAGGEVITADLGAHSPTNFYKGLSGNDIIEHGGIFISTYKIPKIGSQIRVQISLPGGYEFECGAVVRWTREDSGDAPPGFGAQLTHITPESKQLIYRYVRNREPLFYDDL